MPLTTPVQTKLTAEASDLRLPPGVWPPALNHAGKVFWHLRDDKDREGELLAVVYQTRDGSALLTVFND